jgi:hypothetical protein
MDIQTEENEFSLTQRYRLKSSIDLKFVMFTPYWDMTTVQIVLDVLDMFGAERAIFLAAVMSCIDFCKILIFEHESLPKK